MPRVEGTAKIRLESCPRALLLGRVRLLNSHSLVHGILQTKFFTGCDPMLEKSLGIGDTLSSLAFGIPASARPFLHMLTNFSIRRLAEFVLVNSSPSLFTRGAASVTSSAISLLTLHLFFFLPTLVLGGSRMTTSNCSFLLASLASQSKPAVGRIVT